MALTAIQQVRLLVQDNSPGLYFLSDDEITYLLDRNNQSINRSAMEAARIILFQLSMRGDESVDILSIKGSKAAFAYKEALQLYIKNPDMNPALTLSKVYAGNISKSDMQANVDNSDNNVVTTAGKYQSAPVTVSRDFFSVI